MYERERERKKLFRHSSVYLNKTYHEMANKQHKYNILREEITQQQQTIQANRKIEKKTWERHD